jgi:hypothetical protein
MSRAYTNLHNKHCTSNPTSSCPGFVHLAVAARFQERRQVNTVAPVILVCAHNLRRLPAGVSNASALLTPPRDPRVQT